ncbi:ubiquinone/menaquinone biosynthesis methyltransferase [Fundidesulfovibrio soli]|uniref:ubiquinone/menaquinone biosynthesis methyltransferase n=1 Tax=Fundidesulfovibrio soli TaxID=2922716 RepID=UPI00235160C0|nr:ubiquinone/menaquinone biosynthesis methyltransferase [Fundidesulfovibrio soli]
MPLLDGQVRRMFEEVAFSYDLQNSVLSLRRDSAWRRALADRLPPGRPLRVLDVAAGTAEVALEICRRRPLAQVLGLDYSPSMLAVGRGKLLSQGLAGRLSLCLGDARRLPVRDTCMDAVSIAFGIRNVDDRATALAEFRRVLRPGGRALVLEFSLPEASVPRRLYRLYFEHVLPPLGNFLSRSDYAYDYLVESVLAFPKPEAFAQELTRAGFGPVSRTPLSLGIVQLYEANVPNRPAQGAAVRSSSSEGVSCW